MNNRKKVAILLPWLKMGGTNKIALTFMKELSHYCDVTLILSQYTGELLSQLPENIHVIVDEMREFRDIFYEDLKKFHIPHLIQDAIYYGNIRMKRDSVDNYRYLVERHKYICDTEFDCAISYHGQSPERLLNLLYRVHAKKKVAWIHGEFNNSDDHYRRMNGYYNQLDHLFFVSNHTLDSFMKKFSVEQNRCSVYYNPIDAKEIQEKALLPCESEFDSSYINLLTVGRISKEKGQDMIPAITRKLIDAGHKVRWYVVGDGDARNHLENLIREFRVEDSVILLGTRTNPYCYMRACDIYIQPSYTEGYCTTICEAGILGKAIIGTEPSGGIRDQITDGEDGMIVNADSESIHDAIQVLIFNPDTKSKFETYICNKNFEGKGEIHKFLQLIKQ